MGAALERDERVLTGESGGSRHLRKGIGCVDHFVLVSVASLDEKSIAGR
jgi:hypothetical protein